MSLSAYLFVVVSISASALYQRQVVSKRRKAVLYDGHTGYKHSPGQEKKGCTVFSMMPITGNGLIGHRHYLADVQAACNVLDTHAKQEKSSRRHDQCRA